MILVFINNKNFLKLSKYFLILTHYSLSFEFLWAWTIGTHEKWHLESEYWNKYGNQVKVVIEFKLLGIIIDNKLSFIKNTCKLKKSINTRLYSKINSTSNVCQKFNSSKFNLIIAQYYFSKFIIRKLANTK